MTLVADVYAFRGFSDETDDRHVCVANWKQVRAHLTKREIDDIFFGHVRHGVWPSEPFVGVWGARNVSRFRSLLRARGFDLRLHREPPPAKLTVWTTMGKARAEATAAKRARLAPTS